MSRISTELILDHKHTIIRKQKVNRIEDKVHKELMFLYGEHKMGDRRPFLPLSCGIFFGLALVINFSSQKSSNNKIVDND